MNSRSLRNSSAANCNAAPLCWTATNTSSRSARSSVDANSRALQLLRTA
eukprot:CAMPEP_0203927604 /NCGR_PEP_ID=MMETSP0359-20131031/67006_1 /ASSEMBLY_ACC=CAM_ASM_000338 /TAXON_ID=268821 /ORGANISM="Scrippsiella Hangoei, Strain SHTV-5" /LENGTH=48 /DNA_ID= /DNA_START= /DNA_END= /DNA_ORIENTATION=